MVKSLQYLTVFVYIVSGCVFSCVLIDAVLTVVWWCWKVRKLIGIFLVRVKWFGQSTQLKQFWLHVYIDWLERICYGNVHRNALHAEFVRMCPPAKINYSIFSVNKNTIFRVNIEIKFSIQNIDENVVFIAANSKLKNK